MILIFLQGIQSSPQVWAIPAPSFILKGCRALAEAHINPSLYSGEM
jgi:hypothetical protein